MKRKHLIMISFVIIALFSFIAYLKINISNNSFKTFSLSKEPDGIFTSDQTNKIAIVTDGELTIFDENGKKEKIDTGFPTKFVEPFDNYAMVIDTENNLYQITYNNSNLEISDILLENVIYVSSLCDINGDMYCYIAIDEAGDVYVCGNNEEYLLGVDNNTYIEKPIKLDYIKNVKKITYGNGFTLLLTREGTVYIAGREKMLDSVEGTSTYYQKFTAMEDLDNVKDIHSGFNTIITLEDDIKILRTSEYTLSSEDTEKRDIC